MVENSIVIVGMVAAIHLRSNYNVLVIERNEFPKHKVCGEYISNEVLPYLKSLGLISFES
jgi:flavin-dependent dehydrogenase